MPVEHAPFDLDALEARALEALARTYECPDFMARFWIQKGIEAMRLAVAEAKRDAEDGDR